MNPMKLEDIARVLDISVSTVSRAISGKGRVGEKTRERVMRIVRESGYHVNDVARSLRMKTVKNMGIVVPEISNSFFSSVIMGAQRRCRQSDYTLIVCNSDEDALVEDEMLRTLLSKQVSGLVLASVGGSRSLVEQYRQLGIPVVYIDNIPSGMGDCDSVAIDNFAAARRLALSMLDRGYDAIGMITGPLDQSTGILRRQGFEAALRERGLSPNGAWIREATFNMESGYEQMRRLLGQPQVPRAMLFGNNYIAYGALRALRQAGLSVPGNMAVAAFDALDATGLITPLITSINQPAEAIGVRAVELLLGRLEGAETEARQLILEPSFVDGDSW